MRPGDNGAVGAGHRREVVGPEAGGAFGPAQQVGAVLEQHRSEPAAQGLGVVGTAHDGAAQVERAVHGADEGAQGELEAVLALDDLTGGTFSISNGGVFGSMLSTPIINPPQAAILGVHATKDRAVVENGQIVIRPMNYLAMSYDHRIIDGREAVLGLVAMKEALEDPARLLFDI